MKLPETESCRRESVKGNSKPSATLVENPAEGFSDGSSTLPASTKRALHEHLLFPRRVRGTGEVVVSTRISTFRKFLDVLISFISLDTVRIRVKLHMSTLKTIFLVLLLTYMAVCGIIRNVLEGIA